MLKSRKLVKNALIIIFSLQLKRSYISLHNFLRSRRSHTLYPTLHPRVDRTLYPTLSMKALIEPQTLINLLLS